MKLRVLAILLIVTWLLSACQDQTISVSNAWARPGVTGGNSAVYLILNNPTDKEDILLRAASDAAETVELHMSSMGENNMMMMTPVENIPVPANGQAELKPGGLHIMLISLKRDLVVGGQIQVTLTFKNAGDITLTVPVQQP